MDNSLTSGYILFQYDETYQVYRSITTTKWGGQYRILKYNTVLNLYEFYKDVYGRDRVKYHTGIDVV